MHAADIIMLLYVLALISLISFAFYKGKKTRKELLAEREQNNQEMELIPIKIEINERHEHHHHHHHQHH